MKYHVTVDPGLEDIAAEEVREADPRAEVELEPFGFPGHLQIGLHDPALLLRLRTIHNITRICALEQVGDLESIRQTVAGVGIDEMDDASTFRVSTNRYGDHDFGRMDIERAAGAAVQGRYGTPVDLEDPAVNVRVNLYDDRLMVGVQRTKRSLAHRLRRARSLRTALKPTIAAAMIRMAGAHRGPGRLLDPLCGTGTIPVEAKEINPDLVVHAGDWDDETVDVARETVANHELEIDVRLCDARNLAAAYDGTYDFIVTDPPYGVRQARRTDLARFYNEVLESLEARLAPEGVIAIVVLKFHAFRAGLKRTGLRVVHERLIESGGLRPRIYLLRHGEQPAASGPE